LLSKKRLFSGEQGSYADKSLALFPQRYHLRV